MVNRARAVAPALTEQPAVAEIHEHAIPVAAGVNRRGNIDVQNPRTADEKRQVKAEDVAASEGVILRANFLVLLPELFQQSEFAVAAAVFVTADGKLPAGQ